MIRQAAVLILLGVLLASCSRATVEAPEPTAVPPMGTPSASATPEVPSASPTDEAPTALPPEPATPAGPPIPHLAPGAPLEIRRIDMQSEMEGWAIGRLSGEDDHVLVTSDGGVTWSDVTPPESEVTMLYGTRQAIGAFHGTDQAWVAYNLVHPSVGSYPVVVWRTQDRGQTWSPSFPLDLQGLEPDFSPRFLGSMDGSAGWLLVDVGAGMSHEYVVLYTTGDGGRTWLRVLDPYGDAPVQVCWKTGLSFADGQIGWLTRDCRGVAEGAFVDVTRDGGRTWESVELLPPPDQPGAFTYPNACGTHSPMLLTSQIGILGVSCEIYDPGEVRHGLSLVYRTEDGGATWSAIPVPYGSLGLMGERLTWTFDREIHTTPDEGQTWSLVKQVTWDGQFDFVDPMMGWAVARDGEEIALVKTQDGGETWQILQPMTGSG